MRVFVLLLLTSCATLPSEVEDGLIQIRWSDKGAFIKTNPVVGKIGKILRKLKK